MSKIPGSNPFTTPGTFTPVAPFDEGGNAIVNTKYDDKLKPNRPAFVSASEVHQVCKVAEAANRERSERDGFIVSKYEGDPPYDDVQRRTRGLGWQSNVSFGLLSTKMGQVLPAFLRALNSVKYLTGQRIKGETKLTTAYQERITKFIRNWDCWQEFLTDVTFEDLLLGRGSMAWGDEYDWRPKFYTTSKFLLPEGCPQNVDKLPWVIRLDDYLLHEFVDKIKDPDSASAVGWELDNCVKALNEASQLSDRKDKAREIQDWMTDGAYASTYTEASPKTVKTYTMCAMEPDEDGKVSEWVIRREDGLLLYKKLNKYDRMSDCAGMLCYTRTTSGTAHGSKGIGRFLLNTHQVADRAFNKLIDDTYLASLRHAEMPENKRVNFSFKVQAPFLITPPGYTSVPSNMSVNVEAFNALVKNIMQIADQVAGAYTPSSANPYELASKSATQSAIDAQKDAEVKEGVMSRFLNQWNAIISTIIRRILDKGTYDEQAKAFQEELKELGVTEEMMEELRGQDPFEGLADYSSTTRNSKIISFYTTLGKGNPAFDQMRMLRDVTAAMVDNEYANEVLFPTGDPSVNDVAINQQMTEFGSMIGSATPIKPSPADDDIAHLQTSMKMIMAYTQQNPMLDKEHLMGVKMNLMHMGMHIQAAEVKGAKPKELKEFERFVDMMVEKVKQYEDTVVRAGQAGVGKLPTSNGGEVAPEPDPTEANSAGGVIGAAPVGAA